MSEAHGTARPTTDLADRELGRLDAAVRAPDYDRSRLARSIVHIGVGGFHRAHLAAYVDDLCRAGHTGWSIVGSGVTAGDAAMRDALIPQGGLYTLIERDESSTTTSVIGSIVDYVYAADDHAPLVDRLASPEVTMVSLTITEGGYPVDDRTGSFDASLAPTAPAFDVIVAALARRRADQVGPLTIVSCDNVIGNGDVTRTAVVGSAARVDRGLARWIELEVGFPNSMVDRITPVTTDADRAWLLDRHGLVDRWPVVTEPFRQWVIEDAFPTAAPPLADVGVLVTSDVEPYERLKLRLLNASHSCLAYLAALAGFELVDHVMAEAPFRSFVERFMDDEAIPVLPAVSGVDVAAYARQLVERFSNPAVGDQITRLCLDGSSKFPKFLLPTVREQLERGGPFELSALALAGWCAYLRGVDDTGAAIEVSHDPRLAELSELANAAVDDPAGFLGFAPVFGSDLARHHGFSSAFEDAHRSIMRIGVRSTVEAAMRRGTNDRHPADG